MPKVSKEKFEIDGTWEPERTTFSGSIELNLEYNSAKDFFSFDRMEIMRYFPNYSFDIKFDNCHTKKDAIILMRNYITGNGIKTKMLEIKLGMPSELSKDILLPEHVKALLSGGFYRESGLSMSYERIMKIEVEGMCIYGSCDENWKYKNTYKGHFKSPGLIEWNEEIESFLISIQTELDKMCLKVLSFFNTETTDELRAKLSSVQKLIS